MGKGFSYRVYRAIRWAVKLCYPKPELVGTENIPEGACVIVGNHAQMNGPIVAELYVPGDREIWCNAEMMTLKEVPDYAFTDFWSQKPGYIRWFFRGLSYVIAPLSVSIFNNAHCIGVYRDARIMTTFRQSLARLKEGARIVIFPECDPPHNHILYSFQERFADIGRMYARQAGKPLAFVPMYIAPGLKKTFFGPTVYYDAAANPEQERARVCAALQQAITDLACAQPRHRVVPYRNIPKRQYPYNLPDEASKT